MRDDDLADRFLAASPNANAAVAAPPPHATVPVRPTLLRRMTSTSSSTAARRTTTFSDFLSDSDDDTNGNNANDDEDDDDDDGALDVDRMQQQADDMTYFQGGVGSPSADDDRHMLSPNDNSFRLSIAPPVPSSAATTRETTRETTTLRMTTSRLTTSRKTVGRLTNVRAPAVLRRLTSLKKRRKTVTSVDVAAPRGTLSDVDGVILDSDESASERGSSSSSIRDSHDGAQRASDKLSAYSEHDSSFGSRPGDSNHHSFASSRGRNDDSFTSSHGGGNDHSFASNDDSFVGRNDRSFQGASPRYAADDDDQYDAEIDHSFSSAMAVQRRASDEDDGEDLYADGGYDAEEEEQRRREKELDVREQEQEEEEELRKTQQRYDYRLSEEPFSQVARASAAVGFGDIEENPYASASIDSASSSGDPFFVESVRGSSDRIAPIMDLSASPAQFSEISGGSGSAKSSLSSTPPSLLARNSADLSFRTSFVPVTQPAIPSVSVSPSFVSPAPVALGFRVVDHTQRAAVDLTSSADRASSSSSSSSSSADSIDDSSFSSNLDDSFTERPRTSSEDDLSLVFQNHVTSLNSDSAAVADAIAAVDSTAANRTDHDAFVLQVVSPTLKASPVPSSQAQESPKESVQKKTVQPVPAPSKQPSKETPPKLLSTVVVSPPMLTQSKEPLKDMPASRPSPKRMPPRQWPPKQTPLKQPTATKAMTPNDVPLSATAAVPPLIPVKVPQPVESVKPVSNPDTSAPVDLETRKTKKFARPLPPGRKRAPPTGTAAAVAAVASSAVAATASIVNAVTAASSPPMPASAIDTSIVSSRASDVRLDFTGVFLGDSVGINNSQRSRQAPPDAVNQVEPSAVSREPEPEVEVASAAAKAGPPAMRRLVSAQEVSERKVEAFFRTTYLQNEGDDMSDFMLLSGTARGRSKTAANRAMANAANENSRRDDPLLMSNRSRRSSTSAMQMIDLKHVKPGQRIEELLRANEEECKDDDEEALSDLAGSDVPARKRTLSRPSARFPVNENLLEEKFPLRPSTASSIAFASRQPAPPRPNAEPLTPMTVYSVTSGSEDASSIADSEAPANRNVIQRNFTLSLASGTVGRSSFSVSPQTEGSPNEIPMPPNYMLSPRLHNHRPSSSLGSISSDGDSVFDQSGPTTPQLPTLTVNTQPFVPAASASAAAASAKVAGSSLGGSQFSSSRLRSPNPLASSTNASNVAPGFRWHPELSQSQAQQQPQQQQHAPGTKQSHESAWSSDDGSVAIKESVWHAAGALSIGSARPSMAASVANHFQRASATVKNSFQRVRSQFVPPNRGNNDPTSPQSIVSAPPQLPRGYDDRQFYSRLGNIPCGDAMIVVSKAGRINSAKDAAIARKRTTQAWLLLLGTLFGIVMGIGMINVDFLASKFKTLVNEETGERTLPVATKWLLLPGSLFLRIWNCVAMPLLFFQVVNGIAELAMTQKTKSALSFRALGYMIVTAVLTTMEGVGLALVYHTLGLFSGKQASLRLEAASVKQAVNVVDRVKGMAAMMCSAGETYLQASEDGKSWLCSNETITLPVQDGISISSQQWVGSSTAVFAFNQVPTVLSTTTPKMFSTTYYPVNSASVGDVVRETIAVLSPVNVVDSLSASMAPSIVVVAVVVGLVIGLRAWHRSITAQLFLQQSQTQYRTKATVLAESILSKPHPVLGVMVEIQQLLEWLAEIVQCLAPIGVSSLLAGHIVMHRDEWFAVPMPVVSLIVGVMLASLIHILVLSPLLAKLLTGVNAWKSLTSFLPSMCLSFGTGNVVLSVPLLAQNFASAQIVTKSMSQYGVGIAAAVLRSGNALYCPLMMLFLLETTTPDGAVPMTAKFVLLLSGLAFLSCFFAVSPGPKLGLPGVTASTYLQLVLVLFRAWTKQQLSGAATMPMLVVADVALSHVVALISTHDHVFFTRLLAEHSAELCIAPSALALGAGASPVYL